MEQTARQEVGAYNQPYYQDEIDLVDIAAFMWKWSRLIGATMLSGALLSGSIVTYKNKVQGGVGKPATWTLSYKLEDSKSADPIALPQALTIAIKTPEGSAAFKEAAKGTPLLLDWLGKQLALPEKSHALEVIGSDAVVSLDASWKLADNETIAKLQEAINQVIVVYNEKHASKLTSLSEEKAKLTLSQGKLLLEVVQAFEAKSPLSSLLTRELIASAITPTTNDASQGALILIGALPEGLPERDKFYQTYISTQARLAEIASEQAALKKLFTLETLTLEKAPLLGAVEKVDAPIVNAEGMKKLMVMLVAGALGGFILGVMGASVAQFFRSNWGRFKDLVS